MGGRKSRGAAHVTHHRDRTELSGVRDEGRGISSLPMSLFTPPPTWGRPQRPVVRHGDHSWLHSRSGARVLLVGTRHADDGASAARVRAAIRALRPATVVVELDGARRDALLAGAPPLSPLAAAASAARSAGGSPARAVLAGALAGAAAAVAGASGTTPAADLTAALEEAAAVGAAIVCGDADAAHTMDALLRGLTAAPPRLDAGLAAWLAAAPSSSSSSSHRDTAAAATAALRAAAPAAAAALCDARDAKLAAVLARVGAGGAPVVGVVGMAHMDGVEASWAARERWGGGPRARG